MNKQSRRIVFALATLAVSAGVLLVAQAPVLGAQGSGEQAGGSGSGVERSTPADSSADGATAQAPAGGSAATGILGASLEDATALAVATPADWEYDADTRVIHREDEELDYPLQLPEPAWKDLLAPDAYYILRQKGTEPAFTHPLNDNKRAGVYYSRATGQPLFSSSDKYDSRSGWPSFVKPINPHAIVYIEDNSLFTRRIEVVDSLSGSHLGHVFPDGPDPTGQRYCINGAALVFVPEGGEPPPITTVAER